MMKMFPESVQSDGMYSFQKQSVDHTFLKARVDLWQCDLLARCLAVAIASIGDVTPAQMDPFIESVLPPCHSQLFSELQRCW